MSRRVLRKPWGGGDRSDRRGYNDSPDHEFHRRDRRRCRLDRSRRSRRVRVARGGPSLLPQDGGVRLLQISVLCLSAVSSVVKRIAVLLNSSVFAA